MTPAPAPGSQTLATAAPDAPGISGAPVFVCNVPGLDRRRVNAESMPFLDALIRENPVVQWDGHPTSEIWPTLVTGANPGVHNIWHCKFVDQGPAIKFSDKLLEALPDKLVATLQMFRHFADRDFDMPAIPHRRRRHLRLSRLKFNARSRPEQYRTVGGVRTLFGVLGDDAAYGVTGKFEDFDRVLQDWPRPDLKLQWFEVHAYDIASHYNIHKPEVMAQRGRQLDDLVKALHEKCRAMGLRFVLVVDHGQEPIVGSVNLDRAVKRSGAKKKDVVYFTAQGVAKFWFRTPEAREKVTRALRDTPKLNVMDWEQLNERFDFELTPEWGELYAICDNDHVFFPHDFHHILAHLHLGLTNKAMRSRLTNFNIAAYHGQMPGHPAERGFMVAADESLRPAAGGDGLVKIIDVAPTLLSMVGAQPAAHMRGRVVLEAVEQRRGVPA